jgi:hypothetical protein
MRSDRHRRDHQRARSVVAAVALSAGLLLAAATEPALRSLLGSG